MTAEMTAEIEELGRVRRELHGLAELSGSEQRTAARVEQLLREGQAPPARLITGLGHGTGIAAEIAGRQPGPRVLVRCELDALPIPETVTLDHGSTTAGVSHKCGHDGHMAIVLGVARALSREPPARGSAVLLFQPAEETGEGAAAVIADPRFAAVAPDRAAIALHNLPGFPEGQIIARRGTFASASTGLSVGLTGESAHAAEPEQGRTPALAVAELIQGFSAAPQLYAALHEAAKATVIHARVGEVAFGTSPSAGRVAATLRAHSQQVMDRLVERCTELARGIGRAHGLQVESSLAEPFPATVNDDGLVELLERVAAEQGVAVARPPIPFAWSEDFGHFAGQCPSLLFGLGAGEEHPALHARSYDFNDALIAVGAKVLAQLVHNLLR